MKFSVDNQCITLDDNYIMKDTYLYTLLNTEIPLEMKDDCILLSDIDINHLTTYINYLQGDNTFEMTEELSLFFNYMGHVNDYDLPIDYWKCILLDQRDNTCIHRYSYLDLERDVYVFDIDCYNEYRHIYLNKIISKEKKLILPGINLDDTQEIIDNAIRKDIREHDSENAICEPEYLSVASFYSRMEEIKPLIEFIYPNKTDRVCNYLSDVLLYKNIKDKYDLIIEYSEEISSPLECYELHILLLLRARGCIIRDSYEYTRSAHIPPICHTLSEFLQYRRPTHEEMNRSALQNFKNIKGKYTSL